MSLIAGLIGKVLFRDDRFGDGFSRWTALTLIGSAFLAFVPILIFIAGNMRYLADVVPLLVLLSTFGLFMGRQFLEGKSTSIFWFNMLSGNPYVLLHFRQSIVGSHRG